MKTKFFIYGALVLCTIVASSFTVAKFMEKKITYVNINKLYSEFEMKKELEGKLTLVKNGRQQVLDSLELELNLIGKRMEGEKLNNSQDLFDYEAKKNNYLLKKKQFEEDTYGMQEDYTVKIMTQLNSYVQAYGKENNIDLILGAEGSGTLMHANGDYDITVKVLEYINKKYKGK